MRPVTGSFTASTVSLIRVALVFAFLPLLAGSAHAGPVTALDADLIGWYRAASLSGLNDNDPVTTWTDESGSGNHLTSAGTRAPVYRPGVYAGGPALSFQGADDFMSRLSLNGLSQQLTISVTVRQTAYPSFYPVLWSFSGSTYVHVPYGASGYQATFWSSRGSLRPNWGGSLDVFHTLTWTEDGTDARLYVDGSLRGVYTGGSAPSHVGQQFTFANHSPIGLSGIKGDVVELAIYSVGLSASSVGDVNGAMGASIVTVPIPGSAGLLLFGLVLLMGRTKARTFLRNLRGQRI